MPLESDSEPSRDWKQTVNQLRAIMRPQSIAVIGASRNPKKEGFRLTQNLLEFGFEKIYPINPSAHEILGLPAYRTIMDVPDPVDLVTIIIPPEAVPKVLKQCADKGVNAAVIRTEGFAEVGVAGKKLQEALIEIIKETNIRVIGPNTTGLLNTSPPVFTTSTFVDPKNLRTGVVGWIAQTGMFAGAILRHIMSSERFGISKVLGLGNMIDIDAADGLYYLAEDAQTRVIAMYLEGIKEGPRFVHAAQVATTRKPVIVLKGGKTPEGAAAAVSHTASLAGNHQIFTTAAKQAGITLVDDFRELINVTKAFAFQPLPPTSPKRRCRVGVCGFSGAINILATDSIAQLGLQLATFSEATSEKLMEVFTDDVKAMNPIDTYPDSYRVGEERVFQVAIRAILEEEQVDAVLISVYAVEEMDFHPVSITNAISNRKDKPILVTVVGTKSEVELWRNFLETRRIPIYEFPSEAVKVLAKMDAYARYKTWLEQNREEP
ncbi:MAG: acetate--CoA ligase family protein [Candidatus Heimdallarchaeota archaeon]